MARPMSYNAASRITVNCAVEPQPVADHKNKSEYNTRMGSLCCRIDAHFSPTSTVLFAALAKPLLQKLELPVWDRKFINFLLSLPLLLVRQRQAAMAAAALLAPPSAPVGSIRRIPAAVATPICLALRIGRRHLSPFGDRTFRCGLIPPSNIRLRFKIRSVRYAEFAVPGRSRLSSPGSEFLGRTGRRSRALARTKAGVGAAGGNCGFFDSNWAEAVEVGGLKELLILVLKCFVGRRKRRIQAAPWLAVVIGTVTLAGILASRCAVGRVFAAACCAIIVVAILFGLLVDNGKLELICERFELVDVKASYQLHTFSEAILEVAHDAHKFLASWFSSIMLPLEGKCKGDNAGNLSSGVCFPISDAGGVSISESINKNSRTENLILDCKPDVETIVTIMSQFIANFTSIMTTTELAAAHIDSLSGIKSGIRDLCRELHTLEVALLARQNELHSNVNQSKVKAALRARTAYVLPSNFGSEEVEELIHSKLVECGGSDDRKAEIVPNLDYSKYAHQQQRTSDLPLSMKRILVEDASKAPRFHQSGTLMSAHLEGIEKTLQVFPSTCRTRCIPAIASDGTMVELGPFLPSEVVKSVPRTGSTIESFVEIEKSSSKGDGSHLVHFHKISPVTNSRIEERNLVSKHLSRRKLPQVMEAQRIRRRSSDPWQNDCTTRRIEQDVLARGDWAARLSLRWRNDDEGQLLNLSLIVDENSKTETAREDGIWHGTGVNAYGNVDFWGKNAGSIMKANDQRGTLTKSKATGRGGNFEAVDDVEDGQPQEQGWRSSEKEQRQILRGNLSRSRAGQPWDGKHQAGASSREAVGDDERMWHDPDSAIAADDYGRNEADVRGPQILRLDKNLEVTKNNPVVTMGRRADDGMSQPRRMTNTRGDVLHPVSIGGRVSPRKIVSTKISNNVSKSRGDGYNSTQSIDDAGEVSNGNCTGSRRVWDMPPNSEGIAYRGPEADARNGRVTPDSSLAYTPSQPEMMESNVALQQSKEVQTLEFEKYLDEAEALLEQGMQGLEGRIEVGVAERMLYEAANLLEKASEIYPADLIAVGQWGNTLLVHGQLKLNLGQQLRSMLPSPKASSPLMKGQGAISGRERESMELTLQEVCEECEELLVDAGRKFRRALGLDKSDVRALYNWGLALCYRGQLISEEGCERAMQDADKVYLAAIDKFEAMLGISQDYVAGALLNWGLAMQDRSRLRDMGDKERVQLLLQAKELFQDAVLLDPNYGEARGTLAVCSAELKELQGFEALQRHDTMEQPNCNWWQRGG